MQLTGKPDAIVYEEAMKMLDLPADEVLGIGDSIEHDIQGKTFLVLHPGYGKMDLATETPSNVPNNASL